MKNSSTATFSTIEGWRKYHYEAEKKWAKRIQDSPEEDAYRAELFKEGYDEVLSIMDKYFTDTSPNSNYWKILVRLIQKNISKQSKILDYGCGSGNLAYALAQEGYQVEGLDVSEICIETTRAKLATLNTKATCKQGTIWDYDRKPQFDFIVMDNVIEHLHPDSISAILRRCYELLQLGGKMLVITPHAFSGPHDISKYFLELGSKPEGFHLKEFTFTQLHDEFKQAGFQRVETVAYSPLAGAGSFTLPRLVNSNAFFTKKALFLESIIGVNTLRRFSFGNRKLANILTDICYPVLALGVKEGD